jgi:hypothetical protein
MRFSRFALLPFLLALQAAAQQPVPIPATAVPPSIIPAPLPAPVPVPPTPRPVTCPNPRCIPTLFTPSCMEKPNGVKDVYTQEDLQRARADKDVDILVLHGQTFVPMALQESPHFVENVPVFAGSGSGVTNVTRQQIAGILSGRITDWSQVGGTPGAIHVYLHGGDLQRKSFAKFAETLGLEETDINRASPKRLSDYGFLATVAGRDPQAFAIGIKSLDAAGLRLLEVDGKSLAESTQDYPLQVPIYFVETRPQAKNKVLIQKLTDEMSQWRLPGGQRQP